MQLTRRNDLWKLLPTYPLSAVQHYHGVAVEVGVAEGDFSFNLLDHWYGICHMVDPWEQQVTPGYCLHGEADQEARYQRVLKTCRTYLSRARPLRMTSIEAVKRFDDGSLDMCYIDAIHTYESCKQDIALWYPKVKRGGILAGHDYLEGVHGNQEFGVKRAVDEFASANGLAVNVIPEEWPSWWVVKR